MAPLCGFTLRAIDDAVQGRLVVAGALLDELRGQELPQRAVPAGDDLGAEPAAQVADPFLGRERGERRMPGERAPKRRQVDRQLQRPDAKRRPAARVAERLLDERANTPVHRAGEDDPAVRPARRPSISAG